MAMVDEADVRHDGNIDYKWFSNYLIGKNESTKKQSKLQNSDNNTKSEFKS